jgi:hypothetical protein
MKAAVMEFVVPGDAGGSHQAGALGEHASAGVGPPCPALLPANLAVDLVIWDTAEILNPDWRFLPMRWLARS